MANSGNSVHINLGVPIQKQDVGELKRDLATTLGIPVREIKLFLNNRGGSLNLGGMRVTESQAELIRAVFNPYNPTLDFNLPESFNPYQGGIFSEERASEVLTDWNLEGNFLPSNVFPFLFYRAQGLPEKQVGLMLPAFGMRLSGENKRLTSELLEFLTPDKSKSYREGFSIVSNLQNNSLICFPEVSFFRKYTSQGELEEELGASILEITSKGYSPQIIRVF